MDRKPDETLLYIDVSIGAEAFSTGGVLTAANEASLELINSTENSPV